MTVMSDMAWVEAVQDKLEAIFPQNRPPAEQLASLRKAKCWKAFDERALEFCHYLSQSILKDPSLKHFPEIVAFGYWLRPASIAAIIKDCSKRETFSKWVGRGTGLHFSPGNVDTVFVYSLILSYLSGNKNIVRLSRRSGDISRRILSIIETVSCEVDASWFRERLFVCQFDHDDDLVAYLSKEASFRVIWGGDAAVQHLSGIAEDLARPDILFPTRFSAMIIDADAVIKQWGQAEVSRFFKDIEPFAQQACSSPRRLFWRGEDDAIERARSIFWEMAGSCTRQQKLALTPAEHYEAELYAQELACDYGRLLNDKRSGAFRLLRLDAPRMETEKRHPGNYVMLESYLRDLSLLNDMVGDHYQTIALYGVDEAELRDALSQKGNRFVRRVVPLGEALAFHHIWDGIHLPEAFSVSSDMGDG